MFDRFQPFKKIDKSQSFTFVPNRFESWFEGKLIDFGPTHVPIYFTPITEQGLEKVKVTLFDNKLFNTIEEKPVFDEFVSGNDRLQLVILPAKTQTGCMGITALQMVIGSTRASKEFSETEPYCCNLFLIDDKIEKVSFSFSNPEKLLEFYSEAIPDDVL